VASPRALTGSPSPTGSPGDGTARARSGLGSGPTAVLRPGEASMGDERRNAPRHAVQLPAEIDVGGGDVRGAVTRDGSATGLLLLAQGKLEPGQKVTIRCFFGETGEAVVVEGTVVRQDALSAEDYSLYRSRVAVRMQASDEAFETRLAAEERSEQKPPGR
jgi:hypothetical protein